MALPPDSSRERAAQRIGEVRERFLAGLQARLESIAELARAAAAAGDDASAAIEAGHALRFALHNLSGAAPTLGLTDLGRRAAEIEAKVMAARLQDGQLERRAADEIADETLALAKAVVPN